MAKNFKKYRLALCFSVFLIVFVLIFLAVFLLGKPKAPQVKKYDFIFHTSDFETDILSDENYLSLNRSISLRQGNITWTIDENYISDNGTVEFMKDYLDCIISGDYKNYPDFFSDLYFETESVPEIFTMQRVYDITLELISETPVSQSNKTYTEYRLSLDYKINRNDGTLRNDMGSDCIRTQYFLITNREGDLKIDTVKSFDIVDEIPEEQIPMGILGIICAVAVLAAVAVSCVVAIRIIKRRKHR